MAERFSGPAEPYGGYDVLAKRSTPSFDEVTRAAIARRTSQVPARSFLDATAFRVLEAACARLLATPPGEPPIANWIDADLAADRGEGYRHPDMPPLRDAWRGGLDGLNHEAQRRFGAGFAELDGDRQDETLRALQAGDIDPGGFQGLPAQRFFTHLLLKSAVGHFYGQPSAWSEIGFGGPASPRGYVRLELDRRDPWEAPFDRRRSR
jgi:hypothetical protein